MKEEQQKAQEIVNVCKTYVNGYVGSSMLTNTEYPEVTLSNAQSLAKDVVGEVLDGLRGLKSTEAINFFSGVHMRIDLCQ